MSNAKTVLIIEDFYRINLENISITYSDNGLIITSTQNIRLCNLIGKNITNSFVKILNTFNVTMNIIEILNSTIGIECENILECIKLNNIDIKGTLSSAISIANAPTCEMSRIKINEVNGGLYFRDVAYIIGKDIFISILNFKNAIFSGNSNGMISNISIPTGKIYFSDSNYRFETINLNGPLETGARINCHSRNILIFSNLSMTGKQAIGISIEDESVVTFINSTLKGSEFIDMVVENSQVNLINTSLTKYDIWDLTSHVVFYQWLDIRVLDAWHQPMSGVITSAMRQDESPIATCSTASDGWAHFTPIEVLVVTETSQTGLIGNMRITATNGWLSNSTVVPINQSNSVTLILRDLVTPLIRASVPETVEVAARFTVSAEGSSDNDPGFPGSGVAHWRVTGPSTIFESDGFSIDLALAHPGNYTVNLTIADRHGNKAFQEFTIKASDTTFPRVIAGNRTVDFGETVQLDGRNCTDNDGGFPGNAEFRWSMTDGIAVEQVSGIMANYTFRSPGNHSCEFQVIDASGNQASATFWVLVVDDVSPVAKAGPSLRAFAGQVVHLDGTTSRDNDMIVKYAWTVGSEPPVELNGSVIELRMPRPGHYSVRLTVMDRSGNSASSETFLDVTARTPVINVTSPRIGDVVKGAMSIMGIVLADVPEVNLSYRLVGAAGCATEWRSVRILGTFNLSMDLTGLPAGDFTLELRADDGYSTPGIASVSLIIAVPSNDGGDHHPGWAREIQWIVALIIVLVVGVVVAILAMRAHRRPV